MTTIDLPAAALARTRFAISCVWEVVASLRVLHGVAPDALHADWVRRTAASAPARDSALVALVCDAADGVPGIVAPPVRGLAGDLDAELRGLEPCAAEIAAYWDAALAAHWPRIRAVLEAEVFRGARLLAEEGVGALLGSLHDAIAWDGTTLTIDDGRGARIARDVDELILVPSCFAGPAPLTQASGTTLQVVFPARGVGALWDPGAEPVADLSAVLGRCRARLLAELEAPASTSELARRTGMSIGGTSDNLAALRAAGLVTRRRQGRRVLSVRTPVADALVAPPR